MKHGRMEVTFLVAIVSVAFLLGSSGSGAVPNLDVTAESTTTISQDSKDVDMVLVPNGTFRMGTTQETIHTLCIGLEPDQLVTCTKLLMSGDVLSAYTVNMPSFWIDQYEVTVAQYQECVDTGYCINIDLSQTPDLLNPDTKPQVDVTWFQAVRFCNYRGARLPTEEEWQFAASGPENYAYPWGNSFVQANLPAASSTHPVGSIPGDRSWAGVYDMAGNAAEWVENVYLPYSHNPENWSDFSEVDRVTRGGSWGSGVLLATTFLRSGLDPNEVYPTQGFRCARSSPPNPPN